MANNANIRMAPSQRMYTPDTTNASSNSSSMMPQGLDGNVVFSKASTPAILIKQKNTLFFDSLCHNVCHDICHIFKIKG